MAGQYTSYIAGGRDADRIKAVEGFLPGYLRYRMGDEDFAKFKASTPDFKQFVANLAASTVQYANACGNGDAADRLTVIPLNLPSGVISPDLCVEIRQIRQMMSGPRVQHGINPMRHFLGKFWAEACAWAHSGDVESMSRCGSWTGEGEAPVGIRG